MFCLVICWGFTEPGSDFLGGGKDEGGKDEGGKVEGGKMEGGKVEGWKDEGKKVEGLGLRGALVNRKCSNLIVQLQSPISNFLMLNSNLKSPNSQLQAKILQIARSQLGVREATGKNDGARVEAYLSYTGNKKGEPWCASFVSWVFGKAGFTQPRTAWSPALFPKQRQILKPLPASLFGIFYPKLGRVAHCGLVVANKGNWLYTIEGNTNANGAREGDGVYRKLRHQRTLSLYADWLTKPKKGVVP